MYKQLQQRGMESPPVNVGTLREMKQAREPIACLTAYDASFAQLVDMAGTDVVLVGDSLGMVDSRSRHDGARHGRRHGLSQPLRRARRAARVPHGRHAVHELHDADAGARQRRAADAGRRRDDGQARDRARPGRHRRAPREPGHSGLRASRLEAAVRAQARRFQGAGARAAGRGAHARGCARARGRRRRRRCCSSACRTRSARRSATPCRSPSSASAPGPASTARSSCCTTCSASRRGACRAS